MKPFSLRAIGGLLGLAYHFQRHVIRSIISARPIRKSPKRRITHEPLGNILHDTGVFLLNYHSKAAGLNGTHIENLILGHPSNPSNLVDDLENLTEIKSCRERHSVIRKGKDTTRFGQFKINTEQHRYLLEIRGFYLFCVQDTDQGSIVHKTLIRASIIEQHFKICDRVVTKHHYFSLNWKKVFGILKPITFEDFEKRLFPMVEQGIFPTSNYCYQEDLERGTDPVMDIIMIPTTTADRAIVLT